MLFVLILFSGLITTAYSQSEREIISADNIERLSVIDLIGTGEFYGDPVWLDVWNSGDMVIPDKEPLKSIHFGRTASVMNFNEDGTLVAVGDDNLQPWGYATIWLLAIE